MDQQRFGARFIGESEDGADMTSVGKNERFPVLLADALGADDVVADDAVDPAETGRIDLRAVGFPNGDQVPEIRPLFRPAGQVGLGSDRKVSLEAVEDHGFGWSSDQGRVAHRLHPRGSARMNGVAGPEVESQFPLIASRRGPGGIKDFEVKDDLLVGEADDPDPEVGFVVGGEMLLLPEVFDGQESFEQLDLLLRRPVFTTEGRGLFADLPHQPRSLLRRRTSGLWKCRPMKGKVAEESIDALDSRPFTNQLGKGDASLDAPGSLTGALKQMTFDGEDFDATGVDGLRFAVEGRRVSRLDRKVAAWGGVSRPRAGDEESGGNGEEDR